MASEKNRLPKKSNLTLPVTTAGENPLNLLYSSNIQLITRLPVEISGPGTSTKGPMSSFRFCTSLRVRRSSSESERRAGSTTTAPLLPPIGRFQSAVLHVMSDASARVSSIDDVGAYL